MIKPMELTHLLAQPNLLLSFLVPQNVISAKLEFKSSNEESLARGPFQGYIFKPEKAERDAMMKVIKNG